MNVQTFLQNETFYRKLALTLAIIRSTPSHLTPREYTLQLQNTSRRNQTNNALQFEQMLSELRSLRKSSSIVIPTKPFELLESHGHFLQNLFAISAECNIEIQTIAIETITRIFQLISENLSRINQPNYETLFKSTINLILNYDLIPNIQKHSIQQLRHFLHLILSYTKQSTDTAGPQMLIEQIGCHPSYFLLVFEQILTELSVYFEQSNPKLTYASILINILQKLVVNHDRTTLEQILNNPSVRQQLHSLLYTCLSASHNDTSVMIHLWNIYGRIV